MDAQLKQDIIERFHADEVFRQSVLADAGAAVKREFGVDLPFPARVVADGSGYRVEPIGGASDDLSDDELELVSGGAGKGGGPAPDQRALNNAVQTGQLARTVRN